MSMSSLIKFQYADDSSIAVFSENHLQQFLIAFNCTYMKLELTINFKKSQIIYHSSPTETNWKEHQCNLEKQPWKSWTAFHILEVISFPMSTLMTRSSIVLNVLEQLSGVSEEVSFMIMTFGQQTVSVQSSGDPNTPVCIRNLDTVPTTSEGIWKIPSLLFWNIWNITREDRRTNINNKH